MTRYTVTGMTCAACVSRVEKAVKKTEGVSQVAVSLLTNKMSVEGDAIPEEVIKAVEKAGYSAAVENDNKRHDDREDEQNELEKTEKNEIAGIINRLIWSVVLLLPLMYLSMGHTMLDWPLPELIDNPVDIAALQMIFAIMVMFINKKFFVKGFSGITRGAANMDTLVALGSGISFIYSFVQLMRIGNSASSGNHEQAHDYLHELYFESAAMILTLITIGKLLETISKGRTTSALKALMKLSPKTAIVLKDDKEIEVPIDKLQLGDIFVLKSGSVVPVDGVILEGNASIDESALTGESVPVDKDVSDAVSAGTHISSGFLVCEAVKIGNDTTLAQIIRMVSDSAATKAPISKIADKVAAFFVPSVIIISIITFIVWLFLDYDVTFAITRAVTVLVISCPCALGLATPVAVMVGNGMAARNGILFKTAASMEMAGRVTQIAFDKTGTITKGVPAVTDVYISSKEMAYRNGILSEKAREAVSIISMAESRSEHPLAQAICKFAQEHDIDYKDNKLDDYKSITGNGISAKINGRAFIGGSVRYISQEFDLDDDLLRVTEKLSAQGKTPMLFFDNFNLVGIIAVADVVRPESRYVLDELREAGISNVILTGDNELTANVIASQVNADRVIAQVLPADKSDEIKKLMKKGKTAMVGDGINDAPALISADLGVAVSSGTEVAIESADLVLMEGRLDKLPYAIRLSKTVIRNIHQNLFWAFIYNIILIPIAAGVWYIPFGIKLNPMLGAVAMSLSSFCVVMNSIRLNSFKYKGALSTKYDKMDTLAGSTEEIINVSDNNYSIGGISMEMIIGVKGMTCGHCESRVKKALEVLDEVDCAVADHEKEQVVITLHGEVAETRLKDIIEAEDYEYTGIK